MAPFFLPEMSPGDPEAEAGYQALRDEAQRSTGCAPRDRRIHEIECRRQGCDQRLRVGEPDDLDGRIVEAIIEVGPTSYTIHHLEPDRARCTGPTVLRRTEVYSVTDFD